jgi:hypothetical protein
MSFPSGYIFQSSSPPFWLAGKVPHNVYEERHNVKRYYISGKHNPLGASIFQAESFAASDFILKSNSFKTSDSVPFSLLLRGYLKIYTFFTGF